MKRLSPLRVGVGFAAIALFGAWLAAEDRTGSMCVDRRAAEPPRTSAPRLACDSGKYSFQIDDRAATAWPVEKRLKVDRLDLRSKHRVRVLCDGKPQQSFTFRFSEYGDDRLCLFINDVYQTVQLWRPREARWCTCE